MSLLDGAGDTGKTVDPGAGKTVDPGAGGFDWKTQIPEDIKSESSLAQIKDLPTLIKSYVHAQKLVGADKMPVPKDSWTPEQWSEFYAKTGRPESPDKYPQLDETMTKKSMMDKELIGDLTKAFHKAGLSTKQAMSVFSDYATTMEGRINKVKDGFSKSVQDSQAILQKTYGDKLEARLDVARAVVSKFGDEEISNYIDSSGIGNNPGFINMLIKMGDAMMEDRADGKGVDLLLGSTGDAVAEIAKLKLDTSFIGRLMDSSAVGHKDAVAKWAEAHAKAYPNKQE